MKTSTNRQRRTIKTLLCATVATALAVGTPTVGFSDGNATLLEEKSATQRINLSGKLRMLSQRIVASACHAQAGNPDAAAMMTGAANEFDLIVAALKDGNPDLGIVGEESYGRTLNYLAALDSAWVPMQETAATLDGASGDPAAVQSLAAQSAPVLDAAQNLVARLSTQYSLPGQMLQMDAMAIDIAGRQRMLAQRMSKNVCLLSSGLGGEAEMAELGAAAEAFEASLYALRDGMPAAGIRMPPNQTVTDGIVAVHGDWQTVKPAIETVLAGGSLDAAVLSNIFTMSNKLTGGMNSVVEDYTAAVAAGS